MCGRFVGSYRVEDLLNEMGDAVSQAGLSFELPSTDLPLLENFNVAPTQAVPVLMRREKAVRLEIMQWGLVPSWSKDVKIGSKMINARAETLTEKVSFRSLVASHRCVVPMSGFYEWHRTGEQPKTPFYVTCDDGHLMFTAGLWTRNALVDNEFTFTTVTRASGDDLDRIHDRTPALFSAEYACDWLVGDIGPESLMDLSIQPRLRYHEVTKDVNSVRHNRRSLIDPIETNTDSSQGDASGDVDEEHPRLF